MRIANISKTAGKKLFAQLKKRAPGLNKLHLQSFPAIHLKKMDWMDFVLKFSSEILVVVLCLGVSGINLWYFSGKGMTDNSLAGYFLSNHNGMNPTLAEKNNAIVTVLSGNQFFPQALASDFTGLDNTNVANVADPSSSDPGTDDNSTLLQAPSPDSVQGLIAKQIKVYQTQAGDTLASIAQTFGISQQTIMWANQLSSPSIKPGWQLIILPTDGVLVTATANDTLPDIAHEYNPEKYNSNATVRENAADALLQNIISYNALDGAEDINAGDVIIVPGGQVVTPPAPKAAPKPKISKTPAPDNSINDVTSLGSGYDGVSHLFPRGYCTYYVATKMNITFGGNAKNWLANAKASGYVTGTTPAPRSAVVMTGSSGVMRKDGHVAYVESVNGDGTITISEMNYDHFNRVDTRTISIHDRTIRGYIYP